LKNVCSAARTAASKDKRPAAIFQPVSGEELMLAKIEVETIVAVLVTGIPRRMFQRVSLSDRR
jgi:AMMECR1 domain-containing protein